MKTRTSPLPAVRLMAIMTAVVVLAACGSGGAGAAGDGGTTTTAPDAATTTEPVEEPTAEPPAGEQTPEPAVGGGEAAADPCSLVTADELSGILGVPVVMTLLEGPPANCIVDGTDGASLAAWSVTPMDKDMYDLFVNSPEVAKEPGLGDGVMYTEDGLQMTIFKNNLMVVLGTYSSAGSDDARVEFMKQIAALAAGRM